VFTREQIASSALIADPLTLYMCSSVSDGAAAAVLVAGDHPASTRRPAVRVRASSLASGYAHRSPADPSSTEICARRAYEEGAVEPSDIDVAEVHDAMAPAELLYYEQLGFCAVGDAGAFFESGATQLSGRLPVNPSGGLCSRGHPVAATGLAQIGELVWQLRGDAGERQVDRPRLALAQNSGGWLEGDPAAVSIHILERVDSWR
jgi:acetyl-CoA acetyltransferase